MSKSSSQRRSVAGRIARAVADDLFVNGFGERAERLVLTRDSDERKLGGWCPEAVEDRVRKIVVEELKRCRSTRTS